MMNRVCTLTNGFVILMMVALAPAIQAAPVGSCIDPRDYKALANANGTLSSSGSITFDTTALTMNGVTNGVLVTNQSSQVVLAFFPYSSVDIQAGATVTVTGNRGLALGSTSTMIISADLTNGLSGASVGTSNIGGTGGSGGEDGVNSTSYNCITQGVNRAKGGNAGGNPGKGYGGGDAHLTVDGPGSGGGYGGVGRASTVASGGPSYGDVALTNLYGGSGGSGTKSNNNGRGAGGGGGAIELTAVISITIDSGVTINVNGGVGGDVGTSTTAGGGGGSGGGILLCAPEVTQNGTLNARGGDGGGTQAGGGGGGRIAIYAKKIFGSAAYNVSAGANGTGGGAGTYSTNEYPFVIWNLGTVIKFR
jgi:hypothetical protein